MAVHKSLLAGPGARGSVGNQFTYANWKGIPVLKVKPFPANPKTAKQTTVRNNFSAEVTEWHNAGRTDNDGIAYNVLATRDSRPMSGFNKFMSIYRTVFGTGDTQQYIRHGDATRVGTTLTVLGDSNENEELKISVYTKSFKFITSAVVTPVAGSFTKDITLAAGIEDGYAIIESNAALYGGQSGYYEFS